MNAAVVKFDTLTYSVGTAAENHYLGLVADRAFILVKMIGGVVVSRIVRTAYMNAFPRFLYAEADTGISDFFLGNLKK